jgi:hypothetical protein
MKHLYIKAIITISISLFFVDTYYCFAEEDYRKYNLGDSVNSPYDELGPLISHDGKMLYFIRANHPGNFGSEKLQDIWYCELIKENLWTKAKSLGYPLNNEYPNFISSICTGGNQLLLGNNYNRDGSIGQGLSLTFKTKGWLVVP